MQENNPATDTSDVLSDLIDGFQSRQTIPAGEDFSWLNMPNDKEAELISDFASSGNMQAVARGGAMSRAEPQDTEDNPEDDFQLVIVAIEQNNYELLSETLEYGFINLDRVDANGETLLSKAVSMNRFDMVQRLLQQKWVDDHKKNKDIQAALNIAKNQKNDNMIYLLKTYIDSMTGVEDALATSDAIPEQQHVPIGVRTPTYFGFDSGFGLFEQSAYKCTHGEQVGHKNSPSC